MTDHNSNSEPAGGGFETLGANARLGAWMQQTKAFDQEDRLWLRGQFETWLATADDGKPLSRAQAAGRMGMAPATLTEVLAGSYKGDSSRILRRIADFLADEKRRQDRADAREIEPTELFQRMLGTVLCGVKNSTMPVIVGPPGCGKSAFVQYMAEQREGVVVLRIDEASGDARGVVRLLYSAMKLQGERFFGQKFYRLVSLFERDRSKIILVDEAQKLQPSGLEILRDLHDRSDPRGRRNLVICCFGDRDFLRLLVRSRSGERSPIKPQLTRRMWPVFDVEADGVCGPGGELYTAADVSRILKKSALRVIDADGIRWLCKLANSPGWGALGFALGIARLAFDTASNRSVLTPADLCRALKMAIGPRAVEQVDGVAGGGLLVAAAG